MVAGDISPHMNKRGNPGTLVAAQPGNTNAVKHGVYSPRLIESRAAEIVDRLTRSFDFTVAQLVAVEEVGRCMAILEAVDRELDERGLVDKRGQAHSLLNHRSRISGQLARWLAKIESTIERQSAGEQTAGVDRPDLIRELQWIASGQDTSAGARDRVAAARELLGIDSPPGSGGSVVVHLHVDEQGKVVEVSPDASEGDQV